MKKLIPFLVFLFFNFIYSQNYHDTQGKLEIGNSGQASYVLPIAVPPSISDVTPTVNLTYASGQIGGIAGQGWSISGISYIARMSTRFDIDGIRDGVDFDDNDKLALDGQRLLLKTGTYWAEGSTYETEVQSNTKIELIGSASTMHFIVTAPDGSKSWYGNFGGINGTDITSWYMVRYEDTNGNFMTYHYTKPFNKSLCLSEIRFSANILTNPTPLNKIVFSYITSARTERAYIKGVLLEKVELLNNIKVFTTVGSTQTLFKEYVIEHQTDAQLGYQRVNKITEKNGSGQSSNPVEFEYDTTVSTNVGSESVKSYNNNISFNNSQLGGDFDGDGRLDFIADDKLYTKVFEGNGGNTPIQLPFSVTENNLISGTIVHNNKLNQNQSIINIVPYATGLNFNIYDFNTSTNSLQLRYSKNANLGGVNTMLFPGHEFNKVIEGDFDGNGISEVLISSPPKFPADPIDPWDPCHLLGTCGLIGLSPVLHYLDLDISSSTINNSLGFSQVQGITAEQFNSSKRFVSDFNGDGKADLMLYGQFNSTTYAIYTMTKNSQAPYIVFNLIGQGSISQYNQDKQILFGDFNGDAKTDIIVPNQSGNGCEDQAYCNDWTIYFSNPKLTNGAVFEAQQFDIVHYMPLKNYSTSTITNAYFALDVNKDGKTDIVRVERVHYKPSWTINNHDTRWQVSTYVNNIGKISGSGFMPDYTSPCVSYGIFQDCYHNSSNNWFPIPLVSNFRNAGLDNELVMVQEQNNSLTYINFFKDFGRDNNLKKVTQCGGGIIDEISYNVMEPSQTANNLGLGTDFYSSTNNLNYPYFEVRRNPSARFVSQLKNTALGITKFQDFKYHNFVVNLSGVGPVGFSKTARTAWYNSTNENKTWIVSENDPTKRGATVKSFSLLLPLSTPFDFDVNYTGLINQTINNYTQSAANVFPYWILLSDQITTDFLTNVSNKTEYLEYTPTYFLPRQVKTSNFLGSTLHGSKLSVTEFETNLSPTNYYIGRPLETTVTLTSFVDTQSGSSDTKISNEKFDYDAKGNITKIEKKLNNDPVTIIEENDYYTNGLLWRKRLKQTGFTPLSWDTSNGVRETVYTYDTTNRFIKTVTDPLGVLVTNNNYHSLYGLVTSVTNNTLALTSTSTYDTWGKKTQSIDPYGVRTNYTYSRANNIYTTSITVTNSTNVSDGSGTIIEQNVLAQEIKKGTKDLNGNWIYVTTEYDYLGRKYRVSEPYHGTTPLQWSTFTYDIYSRPISTISHTGKVIASYYIGLTATAVDSAAGLTKSKTMNANNHVIKAVDNPGGEIIFKFDASGNVTESLYQGISTKIVYDNWGRKISLDDPSADMLYEYKYNAYGELIYEKTPKGETKLILSPIGVLNQKIETGDDTNITSTLTYNATTKLLASTSVVNTDVSATASTYVNTYDSLKRLFRTVETLRLPGSVTATFTKQFTFDTYNRVATDLSTAVVHGKTSTKTLTYNYKNGYKHKVLDGTTVLWQANTNDARGNVLTANYGNGITITNTYDQYGYVSELKHDLVSTNIVKLNTTFEPVLGNLIQRTNSMFNHVGNYNYDSLDRLYQWDESIGISSFYNFNTTTEGFTGVGNINVNLQLRSGSTSDKRLRLMSSVLNSGVEKVVLTNAVAGKTYNVKGETELNNGNNSVKLSVIETISSTNSITTELGILSGTTFDFDFTLQLGGEVKLFFEIIDLDNNPFGEPINTFYLDNISFREFTTFFQSYDDKARIQSNDVGDYSYSTTKPYRNTAITPENFDSINSIRVGGQSVVYNAFKLPVSITDGNEIIDYSYNGNKERCVMFWGSNNDDKLARPFRRYYSADGSMEVNVTFNAGNTTTPAKVEVLTFLDGDAYSSSIVNKAIFTGTATTPTGGIHYLHRDYQGSVVAITNNAGVVIEKRLFDVWGNIMSVQDGLGNVLPAMQFFDRGYTGHEHLQTVGLIHMNARLYNPKFHRFLSPDTLIQDPYNTQNYNRYGYCWNNPTKHTDITGNEITFAVGLAISAGIALFSYTLTALLADVPFNVAGLVKNISIAVFSSTVTFGIGETTAAITNFWTRSAVQALSHGSFNGLMSDAQGGKFWSGFASGAASSIVSSAMMGGSTTETSWQGGLDFEKGGFVTNVTNHQGIASWLGMNPAIGTLAAGAISGGAAAALSKGNIWQGAVTGLMVAGLNHLGAHGNGGQGKPYKWKKFYTINVENTQYTSDFTTVMEFDNVNTFRYLQSELQSLNKMSDALSTVTDWTIYTGSAKGIYDVVTGLSKINPISAVVGVSASGNSHLINQRIEFYNNVRDNYNSLHSQNNTIGEGIMIHHRVFSGPYGNHFEVYHAYDLKTRTSLGRLME